MSTRRTHLAGLAGLAAGGGLGLAAASGPASAAIAVRSSSADPLPLTAYRTELTLPALPTLGLPYICRLDLFDEAEAPVGTAAAGAMVIGLTDAGPVVLAWVVLQLAEGEIHYQRVMDRFGDYPRTAVGAVLGGTGAYHELRGEVDISWPDPDRIDLVVRPAAEPPPAAHA